MKGSGDAFAYPEVPHQELGEDSRLGREDDAVELELLVAADECDIRKGVRAEEPGELSTLANGALRLRVRTYSFVLPT